MSWWLGNNSNHISPICEWIVQCDKVHLKKKRSVHSRIWHCYSLLEQVTISSLQNNEEWHDFRKCSGVKVKASLNNAQIKYRYFKNVLVHHCTVHHWLIYLVLLLLFFFIFSVFSSLLYMLCYFIPTLIHHPLSVFPFLAWALKSLAAKTQFGSSSKSNIWFENVTLALINELEKPPAFWCYLFEPKLHSDSIKTDPPTHSAVS